jgi:NADH-quinone oxidoreductase subunit N
VLIISIDFLKKEYLLSVDYLILLLFSVCGMFVLISAKDLMVLYMGLELQGLCFYVLASFNVGSLKSTESGLKYFLIGAFASILILFGIVLQYYCYGSTAYSVFSLIWIGTETGIWNILNLVVILLISAGFFFKLALAPFHVWIADVYEGASTSVTAFFVIVPKIVLVYVLALNLGFFFVLKLDLISIIFILSLLSGFIGAFGALYQLNLKRLVAYSAIVHIGFIFFGFIIGTYSSLVFMFMYLAIYMIISLGFFSIILSLRNYMNLTELTELKDLRGLYRNNIFLALVFILNVFSLVGVPPLAGFFGKALILLSAVEVNMISLSLVFVFISIVTAFYYLRLIKISVYESNEVWYFLVPINKELSFSIAIFSLLNVFFMLYMEQIIKVFTYLF